MKTITAFRNLDSHGELRAPEVIAEEIRQIEPRLERFRPELVRLEATVTQTRGKKRIHASLRLQLPSGVIAAQEEGFEVEPVLRKAFADLRKRLERHLAHLRHEPEFKRPARRARLGELLPPARDAAEAQRRALYFDLIEEHLDAVYDAVRRELTYLEASGRVPAGRLTVRGLVDAVILNGLETFEDRPTEFSVGDWLMKIAHRTILEEARAARRAVPEDAEPLEEAPREPAQDPTESDQEMFEFYQPDDALLLEELIADPESEDPETTLVEHETSVQLHRAMADMPALWRKVVERLDIEGDTPQQVAAFLDIEEDEVKRIADAAHDFLRQRLSEADLPEDRCTVEAIRVTLAATIRVPQPIEDRDRIQKALS
ncbi:RNA polymerase sigma factor (sigma-70 family) [Albidovulum inexpectatum]|uniref:RNA polymerase sigma factor (Sigma-70 family) n=1 Tax=Albidovulum inexpectatum TaxID=196587 RepID=A0A2S5JIZ4_9RHOB|nr:flagellar biosynthesis protein FliA [Albidovulum inexpectatum]PPB81486.1 RNA polymerase sigma factor (sigma-70 family) [Albidovulum inexpectatum]